MASLANTEVIVLGSDAGVIAGRIYGDLERTGQPIGRIDPLVAGVALAHSLVLATGNVEHTSAFDRSGMPFGSTTGAR